MTPLATSQIRSQGNVTIRFAHFFGARVAELLTTEQDVAAYGARAGVRPVDVLRNGNEPRLDVAAVCRYSIRRHHRQAKQTCMARPESRALDHAAELCHANRPPSNVGR